MLQLPPKAVRALPTRVLSGRRQRLWLDARRLIVAAGSRGSTSAYHAMSSHDVTRHDVREASHAAKPDVATLAIYQPRGPDNKRR